jgi:hypothetical protein
MELFGLTLLRNFPLTKSDLLGIFKNVLTGFYCIRHYHVTHFVTKFGSCVHPDDKQYAQKQYVVSLLYTVK